MMDNTNKKKGTGTGEFGGPRPGGEGIKQVPSSSLSDNRRGQQVDDQACCSSWITGTGDGSRVPSMEEIYFSDARSWAKSPSPRKPTTKRRRRAPSTTTPSDSDAMVGNNESDGWLSDEGPKEPPPPKANKRLPTDEERLAEMRHEPSAVLASNILEVAASIEQMVSTARNLKGTYVRRLRNDAGKAGASVTELAMRTTATGPLVALEQENIMLRAQLEKAKRSPD